MADIDEAVELARRCLDVGGADYNECDLNTLARAVLAMAARLDALAPVMGKPIASRITNSAPIERELVMDADEEHRPVHVDAGPSRPARSSRGLHAGDYTVGDALGLRRMGEPTTFAQPIIARSMRTIIESSSTLAPAARISSRLSGARTRMP